MTEGLKVCYSDYYVVNSCIVCLHQCLYFFYHLEALGREMDDSGQIVVTDFYLQLFSDLSMVVPIVVMGWELDAFSQ